MALAPRPLFRSIGSPVAMPAPVQVPNQKIGDWEVAGLVVGGLVTAGSVYMNYSPGTVLGTGLLLTTAAYKVASDMSHGVGPRRVALGLGVVGTGFATYYAVKSGVDQYGLISMFRHNSATVGKWAVGLSTGYVIARDAWFRNLNHKTILKTLAGAVAFWGASNIPDLGNRTLPVDPVQIITATVDSAATVVNRAVTVVQSYDETGRIQQLPEGSREVEARRVRLDLPVEPVHLPEPTYAYVTNKKPGDFSMPSDPIVRCGTKVEISNDKPFDRTVMISARPGFKVIREIFVKLPDDYSRPTGRGITPGAGTTIGLPMSRLSNTALSCG